jgi:hypothetical protein
MTGFLISTIIAIIAAFIVPLWFPKGRRVTTTLLAVGTFWLLMAAWHLPAQWHTWIFGAISALIYVALFWVAERLHVQRK